MSWTTDFEEFMPSGITVADLASLSTDGYGDATFGSGTTYKARVVGKQHLIRNFAGIEETARTMVWVASTSTFPALSQYTLLDGSTPELLAVQAVPDEDGVHHIKLSFA